MKNKKVIRTVLDILLFGSVFIFPWYITVLISLILLALFKPFEIIAAGLLMDALYGVSFYGTDFLFTIIFLALYLASHFMKKNLLIYT